MKYLVVFSFAVKHICKKTIFWENIIFTSKQFFDDNMSAKEDALPPVNIDEVQMSELSATTNLLRAEHNSIKTFKLVNKLN